MSGQPEQDPARRITGIDTFGIWLIGYRTGLLETIERKHFVHTIIPAEYGPVFEDSPEFFDPHTALFLRNCPWLDVPTSIQTVLQYQYPSAKADVEKHVNVVVGKDQIRLRLKSPLVVEGVDTYGEFRVGHGGLTLRTRAFNTSDYSRYEVGKWIIFKFPVEAHTETDKDRMEKAFRMIRNYPPELIPATTYELQDLIRFLEESKGIAEAEERQYFLTE